MHVSKESNHYYGIYQKFGLWPIGRPLNTATWGERSVDHAVPRMRDIFQIISVQLVLISFTSMQ